MIIKEMLSNYRFKLYTLINELNENELSTLRSIIQEVEFQRQTEEKIDKDFDCKDIDLCDEDDEDAIWSGRKWSSFDD